MILIILAVFFLVLYFIRRLNGHRNLLKFLIVHKLKYLLALISLMSCILISPLNYLFNILLIIEDYFILLFVAKRILNDLIFPLEFRAFSL